MALSVRTYVALLLLALLPLSRCAYQCSSDDDCALNGVCGASRTCACYLGWKGDDCGALDLLPATRRTGYNRTGEGISSWGGKVIQDPSNATLYHLFAAEFTQGCGLNYWSPYSRIIRAVGSKPDGPYTFANEVVGTFAHNPSVVYSEALQLYLMTHIGCPQKLPAKCSSIDISCDAGNHLNGESGITLRAAKQLDGEWEDYGMVLEANTKGTWDCDTTNPSLFPLSNGSLVLAYRGCPYQCGGTELISVAFSNTLTGPFTRLHTAPVFSNPNEDPFIWEDTRGNWHLLMHSVEKDGGFGGPKVGRHAFARAFDGAWTFWNRTLAYNTTTSYTDGTTVDLYRRERPQLFFDANGQMQYLINGVQENGTGASYTYIQPIRGSKQE